MGIVLRYSVALIAAAALAQAPDVVIRTTTRLVEVTVVAHDKQGRPVGNLTRDDFEVFDNGKPQPLRVFVADRPPAVPPPLAPHTFTNQTPPGARTGYSVLLLDWANTRWEDQAQARLNALRALPQIDPGDKVALFVLSNRLLPVHEFTNDRDSLVRDLTALRGQPTGELPGNNSVSPYAASNPRIITGTPARRAPSRSGRMDEMEYQRHVLDTLSAFSQIAARLAGVPGRKSLIWVTGGFPSSFGSLNFGPDLERAMQKLDDANITVYPVDARGLLTGSGALINIETMRLFADLTGGVAYYNRNDIDTAIREAVEDLRVSYPLGYYQPDAPFQPGAHRIEVKVKRPDVSLRYRQSYFAEEPKATPLDPVAARRQALVAPSDEPALPVWVTTSRRRDGLSLQIRLVPQTLELTRDRDRWQGALRLLARFQTDDGVQVGAVSSTKIAASLYQETYDAGVVSVNLNLPVPPKATGLRILVHDERSGRFGTLSVPLEP